MFRLRAAGLTTVVNHLGVDRNFWPGLGHPMMLFDAPLLLYAPDGGPPGSAPYNYCVGAEL